MDMMMNPKGKIKEYIINKQGGFVGGAYGPRRNESKRKGKKLYYFLEKGKNGKSMNAEEKGWTNTCRIQFFCDSKIGKDLETKNGCNQPKLQKLSQISNIKPLETNARCHCFSFSFIAVLKIFLF